MPIDRLVQLFHRRWAAPILAELARSEGAKFVTLSRRLGASPTAVRQTLDHLIAHGWVEPNPGYGHPLRPEYVLTPSGARLAPGCLRLTDALDSLGLQAIGLKKWSMPVLHGIGEGAARFVELAQRLGGLTDRSLALTLRDLQEGTLIARDLIRATPPVGVYFATPTGRRLLPILDSL